MMKRRGCIMLLGGAVVAWPGGACCRMCRMSVCRMRQCDSWDVSLLQVPLLTNCVVCYFQAGGAFLDVSHVSRCRIRRRRVSLRSGRQRTAPPDPTRDT